MANRLANETSPYLLQHKDNPVDWYPWGPEAVERAKAEDKPILLSIGYSACHWCHVMAHESFENPEIASLMNAGFVNIKVDREERPDLDSLYMGAVMAMTGQGGWPMTLALLPDGRPFFGGTYFPPADQGRMPGFKTVLNQLIIAYMTRREDVETNALNVMAHLQRKRQGIATEAPPAKDVLDMAAISLRQQFDARHGGFGGAPKFPPAMTLEYLLRRFQSKGEAETQRMITTTLDHMAAGGIYDQLGGGFHRYAVDDHWLVPHFEKMLYDNALLSRLYLRAYQVFGKAEYRRVATETLDWVRREMTAPDGSFYSTMDADSEGEEGKFYVWTNGEIDALLDFQSAEAFKAAYGFTVEGNFEGKTILNLHQSLEMTAEQLGWPLEKLLDKLHGAKAKVFAARQQRVHPGCDEKVLMAWNGMMLRAFAEASRLLEREDYLQLAVRNADFLLSTMRDGPRLLRTAREGKAKINAFLEDYANVIDGLLALYDATCEARWRQEAIALAEIMVSEFWEDETGNFFDTGRHHEALIARPCEVFDNATPSGNSVACDVLLRLSTLCDRKDYLQIVERVLARQGALMSRYPAGFGRLLTVQEQALARLNLKA